MVEKGWDRKDGRGAMEGGREGGTEEEGEWSVGKGREERGEEGSWR